MGTPSLSVQDVNRGDILLYHGSSFVSSMIRLFDGGDYSHASIYEGQGNVVEALSGGLTRDPLNQSVAGSLPVDVFRYTDKNGVSLGDPALPVDPINQEIDLFMQSAHQYAYHDILLLALLTATRRLPIGWAPGLQLILRNILDAATQEVSNLIAQGKEPLICSEFVYRVYNECDPTGKYQILIIGSDVPGVASAQSVTINPLAGATPATVSPADAAAWANLQNQAQSFLQKYNVAKSIRTRQPAALPLAVANFVTPRDLQMSPNLHRVGTVMV